jgi:lipoyl synthase
LKIKLAKDPTFYACYPHPRFPTISITGDSCAFSCKHCGGRYLQQMIHCSAPDVLLKTCLKLASDGSRGVLLSGGYNEEGYVPFEPFLDAIEQVKHETGLFISAHTGLMPGWLAREIGRAGVDLADFDLIGDDETIKEVLGIERTVKDHRRTLLELNRCLPHVVPHVCIGLHAGELRGELVALDIVAGLNFSTLVLLVLNPTIGTKFEEVSQPAPSVIGEVVARARLRLPNATLALGCMRPRGDERVEIELQALRSGIDRVEIPERRTIEAARALGLNIKRLEACCAVPTEKFDGV